MLDRFYLIVDRAAWLPRFLPLGLKLVQLRTKTDDAALRRAEIAEAIALCRAAGATLVVNDFWRDAIDLGADWVHLGQEDLVEADVPAIRRAGIRLGLSTHSHEELDRALAADPDYVALGPVYPTTLKVMPWAPQGLERVGEWKRLAGRPLVAIGGITLERAPGVYAAGADSIAVVSDVLQAADPEARCAAWLKASRA
ncbi:thiamine phosphate synthase [Oharaeibacter diazotrophicus]|uniref:Thiamine-phosphate synthase n=1 Tax=Oharaeibacter diazotrophicus TaxID=1920512 RepID=A0A4R6RMC6_9HYPH|nr:thiamine phosphate synthase [Oharaeibacter diazotrophicus]TDP87692.1 thiamine-phosphate diphosphorylase [Oharaeibacter diazotrophicus]BBE74725.1 thiamine-phosphate synthase [Pleomorphomonas sp. SM30]GLS77107.1 thiamine-phosphate synthase [Oharaeibacter diazotrophicus]